MILNWYDKYKMVEAGSKGYRRTDVTSVRGELCYFDIGHGVEDKPILWVISEEGDFSSVRGQTGDQLRHYNSFDNVAIAYQGRVVNDKKLGKISSAMINNDDIFKKNYAEEIIRENFGSSIKIYWL